MAGGWLGWARARVDSWMNVLTNVGANMGRNAFAFERGPRLADEELDALYNSDPFAARVADAVPDEAMREGVTIRVANDPKLSKLIDASLTRVLALPKLREAWVWGRVFGGGAVFVGADDGRDPADPLDVNGIRSLRFLTVLTKREMQPQGWYRDPLNPKFGEPETYRFVRAGGGGGTDARLVHDTRVIRFDGALTTQWRRMQLAGWSESELGRVIDQVRALGGAFAATGTLLQDASQGVLKIKDLMRMMAEDNEDAFKARMELMEMSRSVGRAIMVDADTEDFSRVEVGTLAGIPDVLNAFMLYMAGAARIPVTILMGQSPAGLNATGESDLDWWRARVRSEQQNVLRPRLERLVRLLLLSQDGPTGGREPDDWSIEFAPLEQMSDAEQAELRNKQAQTDGLYIDKGVLTAEEVAISRFRTEGWSAETEIDLDVRRAALEADRAGEGEAEPAAAELSAPGVNRALPPGAPQPPDEPAAARPDVPAIARDGADAPRPDFRADAAGDRGVAIVLPLDGARAAGVAVPGGVPWADLHLTLAFLGTVDAVSDLTRSLARAVVAAWAARTAPIAGTLGGHGCFAGAPGQPSPAVLLPDCPALAGAREDLVRALAAVGIEVSGAHGFVPHVTVEYVPQGTEPHPAPEGTIAVAFGAVGLWVGPAREAFALTGDAPEPGDPRDAW